MVEFSADDILWLRRELGDPEACTAWADGQHCFIAYYEHPGLNDGDGKVMSTHGIGPAACKRCLCGAEVQRT